MTLAYLKKTPRSGNLPTWMVIGNLMKEPKAEWKTRPGNSRQKT